MTDDLLQPTVTTNPPASRQKPWRIGSQVWIAFFGGILPVTVIAILNAQRLGIDKRKRWLMAAAGFVALVILGALWFRVPVKPSFITFAREARDMRIYGRVIAVAVFLLLAAMQKPAEARYMTFSDGEHASLWKAGFLATFFLGLLQNVALPLIAWSVRQ